MNLMEFIKSHPIWSTSVLYFGLKYKKSYETTLAWFCAVAPNSQKIQPLAINGQADNFSLVLKQTNEKKQRTCVKLYFSVPQGKMINWQYTFLKHSSQNVTSCIKIHDCPCIKIHDCPRIKIQ